MSCLKKGLIVMSLAALTCTVVANKDQKRTNREQEAGEPVQGSFKRRRHHELQPEIRPDRVYEQGEILRLRMRRFEVCQTGPAEQGYVKVRIEQLRRAGYHPQEGWVNLETGHFSIADSPAEALFKYNERRNNFQAALEALNNPR